MECEWRQQQEKREAQRSERSSSEIRGSTRFAPVKRKIAEFGKFGEAQSTFACVRATVRLNL